MKIPIRRDNDSREDDTQKPTSPEATPELSSVSDVSEPPLAGTPTPETPTAEVRLQEIEAALANKTQECDTVRDQLVRLMADFDNYRKRVLRQSEESRQFATSELVKDLLPGMDNLERALAAARQDPTPGAAVIVEGVGMVLRQLKEALARVGVRELHTQGETFDPARHDAVEIVAVSADNDGKVISEVQRGYMMHDRLLRPARVVVGKAAPDGYREGA